MAYNNLQVRPYKPNLLANALSNKHTPKRIIQTKNQFQYLFNYLSSDGIDAKTLVVEETYMSRDYLKNYTYYYSSVFEQYKRMCKRIHFFNQSFDTNFILSKLTETTTDDFWESYLGCIVVKPIPYTIIGNTLLKPYSNNQATTNNQLWGTRDYTVHFFGKKTHYQHLSIPRTRFYFSCLCYYSCLDNSK